MQNSIKDHAALSEIFNEDEPRVNWHDETLWFVRKKRDKAVQSIPEWEQLREYGSQIKNHTLSNLDQYLIEFEKKANANGITIHFPYNMRLHRWHCVPDVLFVVCSMQLIYF